MPPWPSQPWILEINTWTWLSQLSAHYGRRITLDCVPGEVWDELSRTRANAVWLMGVWRRSELGRSISLASPSIVAECQRILADFSPDDISGSPYSIREYVVDARLGGAEGLAEARRQLASRGFCLLLDFVPNHVAPDHPWIMEHPEYFVCGDESDLQGDPQGFFRDGESLIARGRDPYFPPWPDTAQLNAFCPALRACAADTARSISEQCDGVRCDMAMLLINRIFFQTWGERAGTVPKEENWREIIARGREVYPGFLFVAEAYWDMEWELLQLGFDYCYDKRLYDRLAEGQTEQLRAHLGAAVSYQRRLLRFLENHDEPRAATVLSRAQNRVAAVALMTLPGAKLLQGGQTSGAKIRSSVHLGRCPEEIPDEELRSFYEALLEIVQSADLRNGEWQLCQQCGWPDNQSCRNLVSWAWQVAQRKYVVVVNLSEQRGQGRIVLPWSDLGGGNWRVINLLPREDFGAISGEDLLADGLYVDVNTHSFHLIELAV